MKKINILLILILMFSFASLQVEAANSSDSQANIFFEPGEFIFEKAPTIKFGTQQLKARAYDYKAQSVADNVQLADARGSESGWTIRANLSIFTENGVEKLKGSTMIILPTTPNPMQSMAATPSGSPKQVELIPGDGIDHTIWVAKEGEGAGRWSMDLGTENVMLRVPARSATIGEHEAKMRWTVLDAPG